MGTDNRGHLMLKFLPHINLDRRISLKKSCVLIGLLVILIASAGYYVGNRWLWFENVNYYDYRSANLAKMLDKKPGSADVRAELAMTNYLEGEIKQSIEFLREVLKSEPTNGRATLYLGLILSEQKNYTESIAFLTRYIKENQDFTANIAYETLGKSYMGTGQYEAALKYLKLAETRNPSNPVLHYNLGQTYEKLNDPKNAMFSYEKALQISGGYPEAEKALIELEEKIFQKINH